MFNGGVQAIPPFSADLINKKIKRNFSIPDNDATFLMTLSALFYKRWPDFQVNLVSVRPATDTIMGYIPQNKDRLNFLFFNHNGSPDEYLTGSYKTLTNLETFIKIKLGQQVFVRRYEDFNVIAFFTNAYNLSLYHFIQSFIPLYFPSYFADMPKTDEEHKLIFSLSQQESSMYRKEIENFLDKEDFKQYLLHEKLIGFEKDLRYKKYAQAEAEVGTYSRHPVTV